MYFENGDYSKCYLKNNTIPEFITALSLYAEKYPDACIRGFFDEGICYKGKFYGLVQYNLEKSGWTSDDIKCLSFTAMLRLGRAHPSWYTRQWDLPSGNLLITDFIRLLKSLPKQFTALGFWGGEYVHWVEGFSKTPRTNHIYLRAW